MPRRNIGPGILGGLLVKGYYSRERRENHDERITCDRNFYHTDISLGRVVV